MSFKLTQKEKVSIYLSVGKNYDINCLEQEITLSILLHPNLYYIEMRKKHKQEKIFMFENENKVNEKSLGDWNNSKVIFKRIIK